MRDDECLDAYDVDFQASAANDEVFLSKVMLTYSEGPTIRHAVREALPTSHPCRTELVIVYDGGLDETAEQIDGLSCNQLKICRNLGRGAALLTGMSLASDAHTLPFDAGLEYSPIDVERMLDPVLDGRARSFTALPIRP
jgi:hypothetical protein